MGFEKVGIGHVDCLHASDERTKSNIKGRDRIDRGFSHRWICWRDFGSMVLMSAVRKKGNRWSMRIGWVWISENLKFGNAAAAAFPKNLKFFLLLKLNMICMFWIILIC
jgi:hypothetical protein